MSSLSVAHSELVDLARVMGRTGRPEVCLWEALASVADYLRRIVDHGDTRHYRADKAGELVESALRVQREALIGLTSDEIDDHWYELIDQLHHVTDKVTRALAQAMWAATAGHPLYTWQTPELHRAVEQLRRHSDQLCNTAIPDPDAPEGT